MAVYREDSIYIIKMFRRFDIDFTDSSIDQTVFDSLSSSVTFEDITLGRKGTILVDDKNGMIPLVRSTTPYTKPSQRFRQIHYELMDLIVKRSKLDMRYNNAMIELYDNNYRDMGYHTDQSLDLAPDSYICLFSCYENGSNDITDVRKLLIKNKTTSECTEVQLFNSSAVLFSTATNTEHIHKIVLESNISKNRWLGITFRLSKTFVRFINEMPYFCNTDRILRLASVDEKKEFMRHKGKENTLIGYAYPDIYYTISPGDLING